MQTFFGSSAFFPPGSSAAWTSSAYWLSLLLYLPNPPSGSPFSLFSPPFLRQKPLFSLLLLFARQFSLTLLSFLRLPFSQSFPAISLSVSLFPLSCLCFHYLAFLSSPPFTPRLRPPLPRLIGLRVAFHHARAHTHTHTNTAPSLLSQSVCK